ncbi:uncharacterized protein [Triticum aestivum]|uniref:uncharacterized protein n=1 Tax=Triticum aestivum TaxID=4565 RepID=UPI001D0299F9|nr:uncharacterized protein LOC123187744 [Triticum aestivum]
MYRAIKRLPIDMSTSVSSKSRHTRPHRRRVPRRRTRHHPMSLSVRPRWWCTQKRRHTRVTMVATAKEKAPAPSPFSSRRGPPPSVISYGLRGARGGRGRLRWSSPLLDSRATAAWFHLILPSSTASSKSAATKRALRVFLDFPLPRHTTASIQTFPVDLWRQRWWVHAGRCSRSWVVRLAQEKVR